jgi:hypothetical protein
MIGIKIIIENKMFGRKQHDSTSLKILKVNID